MDSPSETPNVSTIPIPSLSQAETSQETTVAAAAEPPAESSSTTEASCPRCGGKLISPDSLGWCPKCRYCRSLEEDAPQFDLVNKVAAKTSPLGMMEFMDLFSKLPQWSWVLGVGALLIVIISLASKFVLPATCLGRALWSTIQLGIGLLGLLAAQVWALIVLAPEDDRLGPKDLFLATRLWSLTLKRLPQMARQVWVGAWSVSAMVCAVLLVGGLSYWARYYKPQRLAEKNLIAAAAALARGKESAKDLVESVEDFAAKQDLTKNKEEKKPPVKQEKIQCVILGYILGPEKELAEVVLGVLHNDEIRYAGRVKNGFSQDNSAELLARLKPLTMESSLIPGLRFQAIWVKPQLFCEILQSGYDDFGHLKDPKFSGLLKID
jgi:hypothetical protein